MLLLIIHKVFTSTEPSLSDLPITGFIRSELAGYLPASGSGSFVSGTVPRQCIAGSSTICAVQAGLLHSLYSLRSLLVSAAPWNRFLILGLFGRYSGVGDRLLHPENFFHNIHLRFCLHRSKAPLFWLILCVIPSSMSSWLMCHMHKFVLYL